MGYFAQGSVQAEHYGNGTLGGTVLRNNYFWRKPDWYGISSNNSPVGTCFPGSQWRELDAGPQCSTCGGGGTWATDANCDNFIDYYDKNLIETKDMSNFLLWNNWGDLHWFGDGGQYTWLNLKSQTNQKFGWHAAHHLVVYNMRTTNTASGPTMIGRVAHTVSPFSLSGPLAWFQSLHTNVDESLFVEDNGTGQVGRAGYFGNADIYINHVTQDGLSLEDFLLTDSDNDKQEVFSIKNSVLRTSGFNIQSAAFGCPSLEGLMKPGFSPVVDGLLEISNGFANMDGGCATTEYEETSMSDVGFADEANQDYRITSAGTTNDYRAGGAQDGSDGRTLGVDFEVMDDGQGGADPTAGLGSWTHQYAVELTAISTTGATIEFDRPASNSCNLYLYTDQARTSEHADTSGNNADTRTGNTVVADHVDFVLGNNSALSSGTPYYYEIDCPTDSVKMIGSFHTTK